jgi:hypothetical protein
MNLEREYVMQERSHTETGILLKSCTKHHQTKLWTKMIFTIAEKHVVSTQDDQHKLLVGQQQGVRWESEKPLEGEVRAEYIFVLWILVKSWKI